MPSNINFVSSDVKMKNRNFFACFFLRNYMTFLQLGTFLQLYKLRFRERPVLGFVRLGIRISKSSKTAFDPNAYTNFNFVFINY